jgi:hypothetical protein
MDKIKYIVGIIFFGGFALGGTYFSIKAIVNFIIDLIAYRKHGQIILVPVETE